MHRKLLPLLLLTQLPLASGRAASLHWDGTDTEANRADGGPGTWDTLLTNWDTAAVGGFDSAWTNATSSLAVFGGAAGTVTLGEPVTVDGLQFKSTGYVIAAGSNTLSFANAQAPIQFGTINAATLTGAVGGSGGVMLASTNPSAARTLTLNGTNTNGWTGATTVNPGMILSVDGPNQSLLGTSGITLRGGALSFNNIQAAQVGLDFIHDTAPVNVIGGGTITWRPINAGPTYVENIGAVTVSHGQLNLNTGTLSSGSSTLSLPGPVTRLDPTVALNFSIANGGAPTATNRIRVNGAGTTPGWVNGAPANPILGPWATAGSGGGAPDYAVYNGDFAVASGTAASAETTWTNATLAVHNSSAAVALTDHRQVAALRNTGGVNILTLSDGTNGYTLATDGILSATGSPLTIAPGSVPGSLTATGNAGGKLFATPASGGITLSAPLVDNGGPVTLVKSGANILTLSSTNNTYSGGTVLNAGTVAITADAHLGAPTGGVTFNGNATLAFTTSATYALAATRTITINEGAVAVFTSGNAQKNILGPVVGSGHLFFNATTTLSLRNPANTFSGAITAATAGSTGYGLEMASINDDPGVGLINLGNGGSGGSFRWIKPSGGGATTLVNRQFALSGTTGGGVISSLGATSAESLVITRDLLVTGVGNKTITLAGSNSGKNVFAGNITDGTDGGASVISLTKSDSGTWALSGTNTYTGATTLTPANPPSQLVIQGRQALPPASTVVMTQNSSSNCTLKFLDDGAGEISLPNTLTVNHQNSVLNMTLFVGNKDVANGGNNPASTRTGSTVSFNRVNFTNLSNGQGLVGIGAIQGANGYQVKFNQVDLPAFPSGFTSLPAWTARFAPMSAPLVITGPVRQPAGNASPFGTQPIFSLDGTNTANRVEGNIQDPPDLGVNALAKPLQVTKTNGGTWTLSGTNTFSGGLTLSGATANSRLNLNSPSALGTGTFTIIGGNNARLGNTSGAPITNTNNNPQVWNNDFAFVGPNDLDLGAGPVSLGGNRILTVGTNTVLTVGGAIGEATPASGLNKQGTGTLVLWGANTYTGPTAVSAGKLFAHGDQSAAPGAVTVAANATLGGRGTLGGNTTVAANGRLEFNLSSPAGSHDGLDLAAGRAFTFAGASTLTITSTGGSAPGRYTLVTAPGGFTGSAPATLILPANWVASAAIDGNNLVLDVTDTGSPGGYSDWQAANGTAQPVDGDHDSDGVANGIEWFLHGANASGTPDTAPGVFSNSSGLTVTWTRDAGFSGAYGAQYVVESADTPAGPWTPAVLGGQVALAGQEVRFTFATPLPNRKYAQLKVFSP